MLQVGLQSEGPKVTTDDAVMSNLPKPLTLEEKKYLLAVERGDIANVRRLGSYCIVFGDMRD
jgi:transient-receptor-potential-like protein